MMRIKTPKKQLTLETFARIVRAEFTQLRKEMVRQEDIKDMVRKSDIQNMIVRQDIEDFATRSDVRSIVGEMKSEILKGMDKFKYTKEIDGLRGRVNRIEAKLGVKS